ncbi:MAG: electron transfer flavoprotein subunit beta/FixA family protein [Bacteroidetes bacterium]|nr:electron transfer flavoprotein subunit beta/FixA family protein [Bacteroidota bacterium]
MKVLVCISKTPDTTAKISFSNDGKDFQADGVQFILNPYDEWFALVRGLELTESQGGTVTVINVGLADNDTVIRKALAIGAQDAVRINKAPEGAWDVAQQLAAYIKGQSYDLVLLGKETIDYNDSEVGAILAELLDMPFISYANKLDIQGTTATVNREIEGGTEIMEASLPLVISCAQGMAEQRIPNMKGIMTSKSKPLNVVEPISVESPTVLLRHELPPARKSVHLLAPEDTDELVRLLHEEAKVI